MRTVDRVLVGSLLFCAMGSVSEAANHVVTVNSTPTNTFSPQTLTVRMGDTVTWVNPTVGIHNVFSDDGATFTSGSPAAGPWTYSFVFANTGTFGYHCQPHGSPGTGQSGTIVVIDAIEIAHGSDMVDDLNAVADRYRIGQRPYSSYEVAADVIAGAAGLRLARMDASLAELQSGTAVTGAINNSQSLRWQNNSASGVDTQLVRVSNANCASCSANDLYRIRVAETTLAIPRFNQSGTQVTVLILQNPTDSAISGTVYFWNASGVLLNGGGHAFTINARNTLVLPAGTVTGVAGNSGSVTVTHTGRYGELVGKAVALEPATGFSFDTPALVRPR